MGISYLLIFLTHKKSIFIIYESVNNAPKILVEEEKIKLENEKKLEIIIEKLK